MASFEEQKQKIEADAEAARQAIEAERRVLEARVKELEARESRTVQLANAEALLARVTATAKARQDFFLSSKTAWKAYRASAGTRDAALAFAAWLRGADERYQEASGERLQSSFVGECLLNVSSDAPCWRGFTFSGSDTLGASRNVEYGTGAYAACLDSASGPALIASAVQRIELEIDAAVVKPLPEFKRAAREAEWAAFMSAAPSEGPGQDWRQYSRALETVKAAATLRAKAKDADRAFRDWFASRNK